MDSKSIELIENLNHDYVNTRLNSLETLMASLPRERTAMSADHEDVNNHIHTTYSFSPYSPAKAVWMAYNAGLCTAGIMDHDSISGAEEFIRAGEIAGIATTIGLECRVDLSKTPLRGKRINNPDQKMIGYMALHGIPRDKIGAVKDYFALYSRHRNKRNKLMTQKLSGIMHAFGIELDFDNDVVSISKSSEGGSITERHILFALSLKLIDKFGKGEKLLSFLEKDLGLNIPAKVQGYLKDRDNPYYEYDLLGALKSDMVTRFYIDALDECPNVRDVIDLCASIGAISAYAYLGDVQDSVTGDKKIQKFEDDYIELLFEVINDLGFNAVTYMPSRNTITQLDVVRKLCRQYELFQISGEDINSPRQLFVCEALKIEKFKNLIDSAWALVGHERSFASGNAKGMFCRDTIERYPDLEQRIHIYKQIGKDASSNFIV